MGAQWTPSLCTPCRSMEFAALPRRLMGAVARWGPQAARLFCFWVSYLAWGVPAGSAAHSSVLSALSPCNRLEHNPGESINSLCLGSWGPWNFSHCHFNCTAVTWLSLCSAAGSWGNISALSGAAGGFLDETVALQPTTVGWGQLSSLFFTQSREIPLTLMMDFGA